MPLEDKVNEAEELLEHARTAINEMELEPATEKKLRLKIEEVEQAIEDSDSDQDLEKLIEELKGLLEDLDPAELHDDPELEPEPEHKKPRDEHRDQGFGPSEPDGEEPPFR